MASRFATFVHSTFRFDPEAFGLAGMVPCHAAAAVAFQLQAGACSESVCAKPPAHPAAKPALAAAVNEAALMDPQQRVLLEETVAAFRQVSNRTQTDR